MRRPGRPVGSGPPPRFRAAGRERIVARRVALGLSQRAVAEAMTRAGAPTSTSAVLAWELGRWAPNEERLEVLAAVLRVSVPLLEVWLWPGLASTRARVVATVDARQIPPAAAKRSGGLHGS
ncbi:MAG: hypothetical protein BWX64_00293 [Acidobacteria bacterium ADurb.Bin051]|nr:MAG: hypothetical protein BWX64_00293 [Acidobacteria bacterium ADurb.Bin051]